ncbi:MAG: hypothetical protein JNK02_10890 [Planctomycetes bacterium]|nr:hypothetical protein [Planctomycetota bacterium]
MSAKRRALDALAAALFAAGLALPPVLTILGSDAAASVRAEGRSPAPVPRWPESAAEWARWPHALASAYADRIGLRRPLLRWRNALHVFGLSVSPTPAFVLGAERRVFLDTEQVLDGLRGARPLRVPELKGWRRALESRARHVAAHGGRLVVAIAPENWSVYPDLAPHALRPIGPSRREQFLSELARDAPCQVIDLLPALRGARAADAPGDLACYPHGTHWTPRGALAASRELVAALSAALPEFPRMETLARDAARLEPVPGVGDSWAGRLHLEGWLVNSDHAIVDPQQNWVTTGEPRSERDVLVTSAHEPSGLPRAIVVHDSFGSYLRPVLPRVLARGVFLWQHEFPAERIASERPDLVLLVFAERFLMRPPWPLVGGATDAPILREIFESLAVVARLGPAELARDATVVGPLEVHPGEHGLALREPTPGGLLVLPELPVACGSPLVLELDVELAPGGPVALAAFFQTEADPHYLRARAARAVVAEGTSRVVLEIGDPDRAGRVALRLEQTGRPWTLAGLVARGVPR